MASKPNTNSNIVLKATRLYYTLINYFLFDYFSK